MEDKIKRKLVHSGQAVGETGLGVTSRPPATASPVTQSPSPLGKKIFLFLLALGVLLLLVVVSDRREIAEALGTVKMLPLLPLLLLQLVTLAAGAYLWYRPLSGKNGSGYLRFFTVWRVNLAGGFIESVTPSVKFGGEAAKLFLFRKISGIPYSKLAGIMVLHSYLVLFPFLVLCGITFAAGSFYVSLPGMVYAVFFLMLLLCGAALFIFKLTAGEHNRVTEGTNRIARFFREAKSEAATRLSKQETRALLGLSVLVWVLYPAKVYVAARIIGVTPDPVITVLATYTAYIVSMVPLLPGGLGTFEGSMGMVFALSGFSPAQGVAIALVVRMATFWFPLILSAAAGVSLIYDGTLRRAISGETGLTGYGKLYRARASDASDAWSAGEEAPKTGVPA